MYGSELGGCVGVDGGPFRAVCADAGEDMPERGNERNAVRQCGLAGLWAPESWRRIRKAGLFFLQGELWLALRSAHVYSGCREIVVMACRSSPGRVFGAGEAECEGAHLTGPYSAGGTCLVGRLGAMTGTHSWLRRQWWIWI